MSSLDGKTLKDFARAILGETGPGSSLRYGTVQTDSSGAYVMLDGSSTYTPVLGNVDVRDGDRVTVEFINHQAVITSNVSTPSSGYQAEEQPVRVYTEYAKNNSTTTPPTGGWSETLPEAGPTEYIWSRMVNLFPNGTTATDTPQMITGRKGEDALTYGVKQPVYVFNGPPGGIPVGEVCTAELYARKGNISQNITVTSQDISCPAGITVYSVTGSGSTSPTIVFKTNAVFTTNRTATITLKINGVAYTTSMSFSVALNGNDGENALIYGIKQPNCVFNGPSSGVPVGQTCSTELYARSGSTSKNISVTTSDIVCPSGITVSSITGNGSASPIINFRTTSIFTTKRSAEITMHVGTASYTVTMEFGVALNGSDGSGGEDSSTMEITSSGGTTFKDLGYESTLTAVVRKGKTEITSLQQAILAYGDSSVNIRWTYKRLKTNYSGTIPDNYPGLSQDKFSLSISADDPMNCDDTLFEARLYTVPEPQTLKTICVNTIEIDYTEPTSELGIVSSNGTSFRDTITSTTLSLRLVKGEKVITSMRDALIEYGSDINIYWYYKHASSSGWTIITDSSIRDSGFYLDVDDTMVNVTTTFRAEFARKTSTGSWYSAAIKEITINDIFDGFTHGITTHSYTFGASTPDGADIGDQCQTTAYLYSGEEKQNITIASSDVVCPSGISATITSSGTKNPIITFRVTSHFSSSREAQITYHYGEYSFIQHFCFSVAMKGSKGADGTDGVDGVDGFVCGIKQPYYVFNGPATGIQVGQTCTAELYARSGRNANLITITTSDISCPTGITVQNISGSGTTSPIITFKTTATFTTAKQASITIRSGSIEYVVIMSFGVALNGVKGDPGKDGTDGTDGVDGKDGVSPYVLNITSSSGTIMKDRNSSTTLTVTAMYKNTYLTIDDIGRVYNDDDLFVGRIRWSQTGKSGYTYADAITVPATDVLPYSVVLSELYWPATREVLATIEATLVFCSNIKIASRYYQKTDASSTKPAKPTTYPPSSSWSLTEPSITESEVSTKTIYYVEVVQYSDNSFTYSDVSEYTAFVSSKFALSKALAALTTANDAEEASETAKQDAYDALIAATAYLKLDPVLQKIVISKLGTSSWKTFAIDSIGCSVGEYNPTNNTFDSYADFDVHGVHINPRSVGSVVGGWISMDLNNLNKTDHTTLDYCVELNDSGNYRSLYEYSNQTYRVNTVRSEYSIIVSSPNTSVQSKKGSGYFQISGGEDPRGSLPSSVTVVPGFAIGTSMDTFKWGHSSTAGSLPSLARGYNRAFASATGMGIICSDTDATSGSYNSRLINGPSMAFVGLKNNTYRSRWPEFWIVNAESIADGDSFGDKIEDKAVPLFGFRGLSMIQIASTASAFKRCTYNAYVASSTTTATTLYVMVPLAYPIVKTATIVVETAPTSFNGSNDYTDYFRINSITGTVSPNCSSVVFILSCNYNSYYKEGKSFVGFFASNFDFSIT